MSYTDDWGSYERNIDSDDHTVGKANVQLFTIRFFAITDSVFASTIGIFDLNLGFHRSSDFIHFFNIILYYFARFINILLFNSPPIIEHYLKNVLFINGVAYSGKFTMVKMLSERYGLIHCGENYNCYPRGKVHSEQGGLITPDKYPNPTYTQTMLDWQEFVSRTREEYDNWMQGSTQELIEFEITYLMSISQTQKVIVDTNFQVNILCEIADYNQVAVMLASPFMSVECFFNRDGDKPFILEQIRKMHDSEWGYGELSDCIRKN